MRRALLIILSLLFMFGVGAATFTLYNNHQQELTDDEIVSKEKYLTSDGYFQGKFLCELDGKTICDYKYEIADGSLYLTLYATASGKGSLPADEDGYCDISIYVGADIEKVYYRCDDEESILSFKRK